MKKSMKRIMAAVMAAAVIASTSIPAQAADSALDIRITPKQASAIIKWEGKNKAIIHDTKSAGVKAAYKGRAVTGVSFKSSNPKVAPINKKGILKVRRTGTVTLTVKYNGKVRKLKLTVGAHKWKPIRKTVTVRRSISTCRTCGATFNTFSIKDVDGVRRIVHNDAEHDKIHIENGEPYGMKTKIVTEKVTYIDQYYCKCGTFKDGEGKPNTSIFQ